MGRASIDLILFLSTVLLLHLPDTSAVCEPGWVEYNSKCFYISSEGYNRQDTDDFCSRRNATILIPTNDQEQSWLVKVLLEGRSMQYFIGLRLVSNRWTWDDGHPYSISNVHWYQNQEGPINANRDCAAMFSYMPYAGQIQSQPCNSGQGIICQRPNNMLDLCDIDDGWIFAGGRCLKVFDTPRSWFDARRECQRNQGDLTMFKDNNELRNLDTVLNCRTVENTYWIGLSDTVQPGIWKWINNDTTNRFSRWSSYGYQILVNGSTCAAAASVEYWSWRHYTCDTLHKFVCNRSLGVCPTGWLQNKDRCYETNVVSGYWQTWFSAQQHCQSTGTSLLIIDSADEQQFISNTLQTLKVDRVWLGFSDMNASDVLLWVDGNAVQNSSRYQNFDTNFPLLINTRFDCGLIIRGQNSRWSNAYCFNHNAFFCEMKITGTPITTTQTSSLFECDQDWRLFGQSCYYFGPVRNQSLKSWAEASDYCQAAGDGLVIIGDPFEMSFVTDMQSSILTAWIGLKYNKVTHNLTWVDGTIPGQHWRNETNFYPGEPDDIDQGQECIQIIGGRQDFSGAWDDGNCSMEQGFICEKGAKLKTYIGPPTDPAIPGNVLSPQCGTGWSYSSSNNNCYQVVLNRPKTWSAARADCIQKGGDLLSVPGRLEQNFVQAMLSSGYFAHIQLNFWIGATDQGQEGGWRWTDGSPFRFLNWYPGEPNNQVLGSRPEDCAEMVPSWIYQWNDKKCNIEQLYICKKQATAVASTTINPPQSANGPCVGEAMISGNYSVLDTTIFHASSSRDPQHLPVFSRLLANSASGAWSSKVADENQFIEIHFYSTVVVKRIVTAGRTDSDEWITKYSLLYQESYYAKFFTYQDIPGIDTVFTGNNDSLTPVTNSLMFPFEAQVVRLVPMQWHNGISLRWEIIGCRSEKCKQDYAISGPLVVDDSKLKASSVLDVGHDAASSRIRPILPSINPSCWKPQSDSTSEYINADLGNIMLIIGITIRGNPIAQEWVSSFKFRFGLAADSLQYYNEPYGLVKVIPGNVDNVSPFTYYFKSHFKAQFIQIEPISWNNHIAIAFDIMVCQTGCTSQPLISGSIHIPDDQLNASSVLDPQHSVFRARLNLPANGAYAGAWIPLFSDKHQYMQADLGYPIQLTAISTQGSFDTQDWVTSYQLSYSGDGNTWNSYYELGNTPKMFEGNLENRMARKHYMLIPFIARFVRLWPQSWHNRIALRWELYGCPGSDSGVQVGCFADNSRNRDLPFEPYTDPNVGMWPPMCVDHCFRNGYYYAGLQDQYNCFCGNTFGRYGAASNCSLPCFPLKNFQCGGPSNNIIYTTGLSPLSKVCPSYWKGFQDQCYILMLDRKGWLNARADCKIEGGDLASPNNKGQQAFIYSLLQNSNGEDAWIGFNDMLDESLFNWADGSQVEYTQWAVGQPNHILNDNQDCVLMQANGSSWLTESCDNTHMYVCQMDKRSSDVVSPPRVDPGCPPGWVGYRWACYMVADAIRTWQQSKINCYTLSGVLLRIDDSYEQAFISSLLSNRERSYWMDVSDVNQPGTYQHTVGQPYVTYTNWAPNLPDKTSQCVALGSGNVSGLWFNRQCDNQYGVICKKLRSGYTPPTMPPATTQLPACAQGLVQTDNYCYQINVQSGDSKKSWQEALDDCVLKGGNLASFHTAQDVDTVWRQGLIGQTTDFWIGLNDRGVENGYVWSDQSPVQVTNWKQGEPNNYDNNEDCVAMNALTSQWNDAACYSFYNWICMVKRGQSSLTLPTTPPLPVTGPSLICGTRTNWVNYGFFCYYANNGNGDQGKTWRTARKYCQDNGGDLVSITSAAEQDFIMRTLMKGFSGYAVWIGYNALDHDTGYRWSDGSPTQFLNWNINEPNDFGGAEDCVDMLIRNGKWNDDNCGKSAGYVCKVKVGVTPTPPGLSTPAPGFCPAGFSQLQNRCYRIFTQGANWTTAASTCQSFGSHYKLASIRNEMENAFIVTIMANMQVYPWIGLRKNDVNQFYWENNDDVTYTNFGYGEPNGDQRERCVQIMSYQSKVGQWNDYECAQVLPYICMVDKDSTLPTAEPIPSVCDIQQGQEQFQTSCYFYVSTPGNWTDADQGCMTQGGFLSSVNSEYEQAYVFLQLKLRSASSLWIGLNDRKVDFNMYDLLMLPQCKGNNHWVLLVASVMSRTVTIYDSLGGNNKALFDLFCQFMCQRGQIVKDGLEKISSELKAPPCNKQRHGNSCGVFALMLSGTYTWSDQWPVVYSNWDVGQPAGGQGCVMVNSTGKWNDVACSNKFPYICKISRVYPTLTPPPPNARCDLNWYGRNGNCYYLGLAQPRTALDAEFYCQSRQAHLVSVETKEENDYLQTTISQLAIQGQSFWTGLHKSLDSGFQWVSSSPVSFTNWRQGEPSMHGWGGNLENCMEVFLSDGKWNDEDCNTQRPFVCEKNMAADASMQSIGTGGAPMSIPTPKPFTRPSILPPQFEPTLSTTIITPQPLVTVTPTSQVITPRSLVTVVGQNTLPQTPAIGQQTSVTTGLGQSTVLKANPTQSSSSIGSSSGPSISSSGATLANRIGDPAPQTQPSMSGGSIAGVVLGVVGVILLAGLVFLYWRRNRVPGSSGGGLSGFMNKLYDHDKHNHEMETRNSFDNPESHG